jgi:hypothetical protein
MRTAPLGDRRWMRRVREETPQSFNHASPLI